MTDSLHAKIEAVVLEGVDHVVGAGKKEMERNGHCLEWLIKTLRLSPMALANPTQRLAQTLQCLLTC